MSDRHPTIQPHESSFAPHSMTHVPGDGGPSPGHPHHRRFGRAPDAGANVSPHTDIGPHDDPAKTLSDASEHTAEKLTPEEFDWLPPALRPECEEPAADDLRGPELLGQDAPSIFPGVVPEHFHLHPLSDGIMVTGEVPLPWEEAGPPRTDQPPEGPQDRGNPLDQIWPPQPVLDPNLVLSDPYLQQVIELTHQTSIEATEPHDPPLPDEPPPTTTEASTDNSAVYWSIYREE